MTRLLIAIFILMLTNGCRPAADCPALPGVSEKQIKKNRKKAGKSYGLFSGKVNKQSGYKNRKATKKEKEKTRPPE